MQNLLSRSSAVLCMLGLAGCGQTGALFMRLEPVTFGTLPRPIETPRFAPLVPLPVPPGDTALVPAAASLSAPAATAQR
jgi:hypothetical protein